MNTFAVSARDILIPSQQLFGILMTALDLMPPMRVLDKLTTRCERLPWSFTYREAPQPNFYATKVQESLD